MSKHRKKKQTTSPEDQKKYSLVISLLKDDAPNRDVSGFIAQLEKIKPNYVAQTKFLFVCDEDDIQKEIEASSFFTNQHEKHKPSIIKIPAGSSLITGIEQTKATLQNEVLVFEPLRMKEGTSIHFNQLVNSVHSDFECVTYSNKKTDSPVFSSPLVYYRKELLTYLIETVPDPVKDYKPYAAAIIKKLGVTCSNHFLDNCSSRYSLKSINIFRFFYYWFIQVPLQEYKTKPEQTYSFIHFSSVYRFVFVAFATLLFFLMPIMSLDSGISGDEVSLYEHAEKSYDFFVTFGEDTTAIRKDTRDPMYVYGQSFELITYALIKWFNIDNYYEFKHAINSLLGWLAILFLGLTVTLIAGWRAGFIAALLLFISPRFLGHTWNNPKDIPFAMTFIFTIYFHMKFMRELPHPKKITIFLTALGIAMAISVRIGGLLLIAYLFLFSGLHFLITSKRKTLFSSKNLARLRRLLVFLIVISVLGYMMGLILWPYGISNPIKNPLDALKSMTHFKISLRQVFEGDFIWSDNVPWHYSIKYVMITTPLVIFVGFALFLALVNVIRKYYRPLFLFYLFFAFAFPIVYIIYQESNVYGGWRHVLFSYPTFVGMAAVGYEGLARKLNKKAVNDALIPVIILIAIHPIKHIITNHPYEYVYFNELFGGVDNAVGEYELDYYYHSLKESSEWVIDNKLEKTNPDNPVIIATNHAANVSYYFKDFGGKVKITYVRYYNRGNYDWDYAIIADSYINAYQERKGYWPPNNTVHEVKVEDAVIGVVIERKDKHDYLGYQAMKSNNKAEAISHYKKAIEADPNNEAARLNLAKIYIDMGNYQEALKLVNGTLKIYQNYDKALNLLGIIYLKQREFNYALGVFNKITQVNPKFVNAYYNIGVVLLNQKKNQQALEYFQQAIKVNPKYKPSYLAIAHILKQAGKEEDAKKYMEAANKL